jgi:hypothetical protein
MDFFKSIPGVEVAQVARPTPSKRRKYSIHLTEREAAETRLARPAFVATIFAGGI